LRIIFRIGLYLILANPLFLYSQYTVADTYTLPQNIDGEIFPFPPGNSAAHVASRNDTLWFGTGRGLTRTVDAGITWEHFRSDEAFMPHGIFTVHLADQSVWVSTGYSKETTAGSQQAGSGYTYSSDNGMTWNYIPQPLDPYDIDTLLYGENKIRALGISTDVSNITYSISSMGEEIWVASFAGGLRKSTDYGNTWERVIIPPDYLDTIHPDDDLSFTLSPVAGQLTNEGYLNHRVFSVYIASDSSIWVGTANGINRSIDGGISWRKFNHQNQINSILGNWVIRIAEQRLDDGAIRIWTTNWRAEDPNEQFGVSFTDNHGETWTNLLHNLRAYDFAFRGNIIYIATDEGILRSDTDGKTWNTSGTIIDRESDQRFVSREVLSVASVDQFVWAGTGEGIARTEDTGDQLFGYTWKIFRTYTPVAGAGSTYAYPNPFSPGFSTTRIHYDTDSRDAVVSIEIFDFAMNKVKTLIRNADRTGLYEHDEIWDGKNNDGSIVPNGVYFYRVLIDGDEGRWGKIMVLQ
jgi:ligand-binding sensor domain-containing protein